MAFEKVSGSSRSGLAKISMRKTGSIGINSTALEEYFEDDEEFAEVYFDEENQLLGLNGKTERTDDSYKITRSSSGGTVAPSSFLKGKGLVPDVTTQYEPEVRKLNGSVELVVIDLDDAIGTYGYSDEEDGDVDDGESNTEEQA